MKRLIRSESRGKTKDGYFGYAILFISCVILLTGVIEGCELIGLPGGTVATPTFDPSGGTYSSIQSVKIHCTTSGASIYYTTDGTLPGESNGKRYADATIAVSQTTTIKAIAMKTGMTASGVATAVYTLSGSYTLFGTVLDYVTGAAVTGATIYHDSNSTVTDANGNYVISLGPNDGMKHGFGISKTGYSFFYSESISPPEIGDIHTKNRITPYDTSAYPVRSISGHIYELQTDPLNPTEVEDGAYVSFTIYNIEGGSSYAFVSAYQGGYSISSKTFGSDCLIEAKVSDYVTDGFTVILKADLSSPSTVLDLTEDTAHTTTVTVTGDALDNECQLVLLSPYGNLYLVYADFYASTVIQVAIVNPYGYKGVWEQSQIIDDYLPGHTKYLDRGSGIVDIGASVTLPAIDASIGPTEAADPSTISYSGGILSIGSVAGANDYSFELYDPVSSRWLGYLYSCDPAIVVPLWVRDRLAGKTIRVEPYVSYYAYDLAATRAAAAKFPLDLREGSVEPTSGTDYEDIAF
jgi:hypothetical protein